MWYLRRSRAVSAVVEAASGVEDVVPVEKAMAQLLKLSSSIGVTYYYILIIILYESIALLINENSLFY